MPGASASRRGGRTSRCRRPSTPRRSRAARRRSTPPRRARDKAARRMEAAIARARAAGVAGVDHYDAAWVADSVKKASCPRRSRTASRAPWPSGSRHNRGRPSGRGDSRRRASRLRKDQNRRRPRRPRRSSSATSATARTRRRTAPSSRVIGMTTRTRGTARRTRGWDPTAGAPCCGRRASCASPATARASSTAWRTGCGTRASRTTTTGGCARR